MTALYGGMLAVLVLLFFLRNLQSTAIIATAIPISIIATFALLYFGGFTLNIMTLGGLALGVGMLVDNSIVVLENIYRMRETGLDPVTAAVEGSEEVTTAIVASTLTTLVVFLPIVFVRGMSGVMFKQLAFVVSFALLCSLVVALTLVPMLAARGGLRTRRWRLPPLVFHPSLRLHRPHVQIPRGRYTRVLHWALDHRALVTTGAVATLAASLFLARFVGAELMPASDEGEVRVSRRDGSRHPPRTPRPDLQTRRGDRLTRSPKYVSAVTSLSGYDGSMRLSLVPQKDRTRSSEEIAAALRKPLSGIPGTTIRTRAGQGLFLLQNGLRRHRKRRDRNPRTRPRHRPSPSPTG